VSFSTFAITQTVCSKLSRFLSNYTGRDPEAQWQNPRGRGFESCYWHYKEKIVNKNLSYKSSYPHKYNHSMHIGGSMHCQGITITRSFHMG
jgi:hypothetical protein